MSEVTEAPAPGATAVAPAAPAALFADVSGAADIHGVHGAAGLTHWKCLATRRDLRGDWEAVEWASIPPGGVSGEHRHTRTEEIYFILSGRGEFLLNGTAHPARPGSLLLTGTGAVHGLRNTGEDHLDWLVIEMLAPPTAAALRGDTPRAAEEKTVNPANAELHDLRAEGSVDPGRVFTGPLRTVEIDTLEPSATRTLHSRGAEHTVFVLSGSGWAASGGTTVELAPGTALTLPLGTTAEIAANHDGMEFFHAELAVPAPAAGEER
ncbi:cupin domain-containing protein [Streptomyces roseifaciens]|uniref:cupin domain-containing protein n=1 Tax=Streptomyces roseifaciens TaxID=1488406 RepID=UPI0007181D39|nr:cupin domain-containing protein [Streptomyces roseifaciens]